jgi:hypothetical protein
MTKGFMRFFVDERGGCIAVRDRVNTDNNYAGLHSDTEGVVKYWHGFRKMKTCVVCKHESLDTWEINADDRFSAYELCEALNMQYERIK